MKKLLVTSLILVFVVSTTTAFACYKPNCTHNKSNSTSNATGIGVGLAVAKGGNANAIAGGGNAGVFKSGNSSNIVKPTINTQISNDIKNKIKNDVDVNNRINNKDVNINKVRNTNKQKQNQGQLQGQLQGQNQKAVSKQSQSANNEGITIEGDTIEDNSVYMAPPSTTPLQGTISAQVTTVIGGAGFSKDARYMIYMAQMDYIQTAVQYGYVSEEQAKKDGAKLYKKFIKSSRRGLLRTVGQTVF